MGLYFEDVVADETHELGVYTFTRDSIIAFAKDFDPQAFHLSEEGGKASIYGAMIASGWQTTSVWLRMLIDERTREADMMRFRGERPARYGPSPGFENLKWIKPVYVGDSVRYTTRVIEKRDSRSRPGVGLLLFQNEGHNQRGELVFSLVSKMFVERREAFKG
jgi:acyl dehydratase